MRNVSFPFFFLSENLLPLSLPKKTNIITILLLQLSHGTQVNLGLYHERSSLQFANNQVFTQKYFISLLNKIVRKKFY